MTKTDKIAVVAGGTAGVGRAVVSRLLAKGYRVGILARGRERLDALAEELGDRVLCLPCDVGDAARVARAGAAIEETLGPISVWVNCAMLTSFSPFPSVAPDEFDAIVRTTLLGTVNGTRTALSLMEHRHKGRIINVGSGLAYRSVPYQSAYCASKHGILGFTASIRSELIRESSGITIGMVQLPAINTPQFTWALNRLPKKPQPAPPIYAPDLAARAVMKAIGTGRREYLVGKSAIQLVLGNLILPDWLDHKMADSGAEMQKSDADEPGGRPNNLTGPVDGMPPRADGDFRSAAKDDGLIVDGDRLRQGVFLGGPLLLFVLGLLLG